MERGSIIKKKELKKERMEKKLNSKCETYLTNFKDHIRCQE